MAEEDKDQTTAPEGEAAAPEATPAESGAESTAAAQPAAAAEPEERLHPKEARRRARSRHPEGAKAGKPRTPQERQAERDARRAAKAKQRSAYRAKARSKAKAEHAAHPAPAAPPAPERTGHPQLREGIVVSDKADKTITVRIDVARRHRRYKKVIRSSSTFHAHDERNDAHEGDTVRIVESRPLSRTKRWRLVEVLERAK